MANEQFEIEDDQDVGGGVPAAQQHPAERLQSFIGHANIAPLLDADVVKKIGMEVVRGYDADDSSRADWAKMMQKAMDLAMQVTQAKNWPWAGAANVKYPLITTGAIQFSARAYPAIVQGEQVVKGMVMGPDPDGMKKERADRIGRHMSYQLLEEIEDWDEDTDKLLLQMAIVGCCFRKTYFDVTLGRPRSEMVPAKYVVFDHATPWKDLRRHSQWLPLYKNDVIERVRGGVFVDVKLGTPAGATDDEDAPHEFIEQHCWYDLDGDGYKEPYIVTVVKETSEVARIVARFDEDGIYLNGKGEVSKISPVGYWTKYPFMPNPDGGSYDVGLGLLLNPINETINTVLNQLLDAGTLANTGGGFIGAGLKMKGGAAKFAPGEYKPVDNAGAKIADSIYHMQFPGPSPVLFQLLGMLIEAGKDISSVKDILTGEQQSANQPATTTLALIEQGQKVFSAIYKRVHRSLKQEFSKLFRLNRLYLQPEEYYRFQDKSEPIYLEDYQGDGTDVVPVSDPNLVSDAQELARAEALLQFKGDPFINQVELRRGFLKALKVPDIEALIVENPEPPQDPKVIEVQAKMEAMHVEVNAKAEKTMAEVENLKAKTAQAEADAGLKLAQAAAVGGEQNFQLFMAQVQHMLNTHLEQTKAALQPQQPPQGGSDDGSWNEQGRVPAVGGSPADEEVPPVPAGLPPDADGEMGAGGAEPGQPGIDDGGGALPNG